MDNLVKRLCDGNPNIIFLGQVMDDFDGIDPFCHFVHGDQELIQKGKYFLNNASTGTDLSRYHLEAGIAYWHTQKEDSSEKWESILNLYDNLLIIEYSPIAALNRTYALSKTKGKQTAIIEAEKLVLTNNHFYYSLLGNLYIGIDNQKAQEHFETALSLAISIPDRSIIGKQIQQLSTLK